MAQTPRRLFRAALLVVLGFAAGGAMVGLVAPPFERIAGSVRRVGRKLGLSPGPTIRFHAPREDGLTDEQRERIERLQALAYVAGATPKTEKSGVTVHAPGRAQPGLNLCADGHSPTAVLLDMDGKELHRWSKPFAAAFPALSPKGDPEGCLYWRHVRLLAGGELLAIYEGQGLIKLDRDSRVLWAYPGAAHHDLDIDAEGRIYVLTRVAEMVPRINPEDPVSHDYVTILSPDGKELQSYSVLKAIEESDYSALLRFSPRKDEIFHTNSIQILDGSLAQAIPAFAPGRILIGMATNNALAVLDLEHETVRWAMAGPWAYQHQPRVMPSGSIMVFDNQGDRGRSRVVEFDPRTQQTLWSYRGSEHGFYTEFSGMYQRLRNGNTLIVESDYGRAFEVTREGKTVWEYYTPNRAGEKKDLVASLFEVHRIDRADADAWLGRAAQ